MTNTLSQYKWVFMGTPQIAVDFLTALKDHYNISPDLIVTNDDKPVGRKKIMTSPPVKDFADSHGIAVIQTTSLDDIADQLGGYDFFCVFAFSQLLKQSHLDLPVHGAVNLHPSLLPQYRGASPITAAILNDTQNTGISLMILDAGMDSGPIIAQQEISIDLWQKYTVHEHMFAVEGADLFSEHMPRFLSGDISPEHQDTEQASYCRKHSKNDMQIDLEMDPYEQYRHYCAFPKPYFVKKNKRYIITDALFNDTDNTFIIKRLIPEGKAERDATPEDFKD